MRLIINSLLAGTAWGAWILASPFKLVLDVLEDAAVNWLANRGLIVIDVGAVLVDGVISEAKLTNALNSAFDKLKIGRENISPADGAEIDADTTEVFDEFADIPVADGVPNLSNPPI